ncbi:MAG: hypothetical protein IPJ88_11870 [Myxococcales bacterium]|nr:MAG: hypothetical protein IPJ88_11870 [Myxococcales bacterium]
MDCKNWPFRWMSVGALCLSTVLGCAVTGSDRNKAKTIAYDLPKKTLNTEGRYLAD